MNELAELVSKVTQAYGAYEFHRAFKDFIDPFCANTLSATYHAILKDRLYTYAPNHPHRRSSQTAISIIFSVFVRLVAPLIPHTADEAWSHAYHKSDFSSEPIALTEWPQVDPSWQHPETASDIRALRTFLSEKLNEGLEDLRQKKIIGQSLDARATITGSLEDPEFARLKRYESDLPELFILSQVNLVESSVTAPEMTIQLDHAEGVRCPRSWRWVPALVETKEWGSVSPRCAEALYQILSKT